MEDCNCDNCGWSDKKLRYYNLTGDEEILIFSNCNKEILTESINETKKHQDFQERYDIEILKEILEQKGFYLEIIEPMKVLF